MGLSAGTIITTETKEKMKEFSWVVYCFFVFVFCIVRFVVHNPCRRLDSKNI